MSAQLPLDLIPTVTRRAVRVSVGDRVRTWSSGHGAAIEGVVELVSAKAGLVMVDGAWCAMSDVEVLDG